MTQQEVLDKLIEREKQCESDTIWFDRKEQWEHAAASRGQAIAYRVAIDMVKEIDDD